MSDRETEVRSVLILAVAAATGWWLAEVICLKLTTAQLALLAAEAARV